MAEGTVRWFNSERGYGFIAPDGGGPDVFVHYSSIQANGYKSLDELERVSFDIELEPNGLVARRVTLLGTTGSPPPPPMPARRPPPWWLRWLSRL